MTEKNDPVEYLRKVTAALQEAKLRLRKHEDARHEPIAIVSMACRFPGGVESPEDLWRLLDEGGDAVTGVPASRWDVDAAFDPQIGAQGRTYSRWGGFVGDVDRFDPQFFGIGPLEAQSCDPQQRLLLETTWEVVERAGLTPSDLAGSSTGVFVGIFGNEYQVEVMRDHQAIDAYSMLGTDHGLIAGRISYWLGLHGPNVPVDTACSSSAVALHLACQALRNGECDMALAGGVNLLLSPWGYVYLSRLHLLSPTGRSRAFSEDADGFARAEGCGMVLLKRLSDAQRMGDEVLAVIRGSAVNHDGRTNGFTAPSGPSQEEVLRRALKQARVEATTVDVVECHSTGTQLGDPIEVQALGAVYGDGRPADRPLVLGSIKTNIGHAEGAAGIAGVMKAVLSLQHRRIPRVLHHTRPNPLIPWDELRVRVAAEALPWERGDHPRRVGVSSFAMSGTNAHLILEEAPEAAPRAAPELSSYILPLSAKSAAALLALARSYGELLSSPGHDARLPDVVYSASVRRAHWEHRLAVVGRTREDFARALAAFARGDTLPGLAHGQVPAEGRPTQVWVFSDESSRWAGMGRQLLAEEPVFRKKLEACAELLRKHVSWSLLDEIAAPEERSRLAEPEIAQAAVFAIQVSLAELLRAWGAAPDAVLGAGVGEVAAAHVAGALSLEESVRVLAWRGRILRSVAGHGPEVQMDALGRVGVTSASVPVYSSLKDGAIDGEALDSDHWARHARGPAQLGRAVASSLADGHRFYVEIGPHPVLAADLAKCVDAGGRSAHVVPTLQKQSDERVGMLNALGEAYSRGCEVAWKALHPSEGRCVLLPTYPWQRERYWLSPAAVSKSHAGVAKGTSHPFLGRSFTPASQPGTYYWEQSLSTDTLPYLQDHRVRGQMVFPGSAYVEIALAAANEVYGDARFMLEALSFESMLTLGEGQAKQVQVSLVDERGHRASLTVVSRDENTGEWVRHARVTLGEAHVEAEQLTEPPRLTLERCPTELPGELHYARMGARQIQYGPAFHGMERIWVGTNEAVGRVRLPEGAGDPSEYRVHPALLDACFQICAALIGEGEETIVPVEIARILLHRRSWSDAWVRATPSAASEADGERVVDIAVVDDKGRLLLEISGLKLRRLAQAAIPDPFAGCAYTVVWRSKPLVASSAATSPSSQKAPSAPTWLVFTDSAGTGEAVADELHAQGQRCVEVAAGQRFERRGAGSYAIDPSKQEDYQRLFREVVNPDTRFGGVVHCWNLDAGALADTTAETLLVDVRRGSMSILRVVQELVWHGFRDAPRLLVVTRSAQAVGEFASELAMAQATSWGLGRTISMEQPDLGCTRVDLDPAPWPDEAVALARELVSSDGEDQIAFRGGRRLVARLDRGDLDPVSAPTFDGDGSYLITGGLGGLGLSAARWLVASGARHILLLGRSEPSEQAHEAIRAMTDAGAQVRTWRADVTRIAEVEGALAYMVENMPRLRGIIHAAGVLEDRTLQEMSEDQFMRVIRPKILGGWNLHVATRKIPLDFFLMYSSAAALLGPPGQGNYAAANAFFDAFAHVRAALNLPAMSIQWGTFSEIGMAAAQENRGQRMAHRGIESFTPEEGNELLSRLIEHPWGEIGLLRMSVRQWVEFYPRAASAPFLSRLRNAEERAGATNGASAFLDALRAMSRIERRPALERHVAECLGQVLRLPPERIEVLAPLRGYGMDSLMSLEIRNRLEASLGLRLSAALLFTYPTIAALVDHLLVELRLEAAGMEETFDSLTGHDEASGQELSEAVAVAMLDAKINDVEGYLNERK